MTVKNNIPYLSEEALVALGITTFDVIESIEAMIDSCDRGSVWSAPKAVIQPGDGRYMMAALAAADDPALLAVKMVVLNPRNSDRNLPQINGLVTLLNSDTGLPVAILDGNWIKDSFSVLDQITIDDLAQEAALPNKLGAPQ